MDITEFEALIRYLFIMHEQGDDSDDWFKIKVSATSKMKKVQIRPMAGPLAGLRFKAYRDTYEEAFLDVLDNLEGAFRIQREKNGEA